MQSYISTSTAALLTGEDRRRVFEKITDGVYEARKQSSGRGGNGGESYQIAVSSPCRRRHRSFTTHNATTPLAAKTAIWLPTTPASARRASRSCWASSGPSGRAARSAR